MPGREDRPSRDRSRSCPCPRLPARSPSGQGGGVSRARADEGRNRLYAFGRGRDGQLGNGKSANGAGYVQDLAGVVSFGAGIWHSVALTTDGAVWVWGNNSKSQLCDGATTNRAVPAKSIRCRAR